MSSQIEPREINGPREKKENTHKVRPWVVMIIIIALLGAAAVIVVFLMFQQFTPKIKK